MIITHLPEGYNSVSEILNSDSFKKFRRTLPKKEVNVEETTPKLSPLELFLKQLEVKPLQ